ncbi:MAG: primosomal protein N' [Candidatus Peregrinibacteria bacterium]
MLCTVITASRSRSIGSGLTYDSSDLKVCEGSHVIIPLQRGTIEGIVVKIDQQKTAESFAIKAIADVIGHQPLLTEPQIQTLAWMAEEYACTLRHALSVWLPAPSWKNLAPIRETYYRLIKPEIELKGKRQQRILEVLRGLDWMKESTVIAESGAPKSSLKAFVDTQILEMESRMEMHDERSPAQILNQPVLTKAQQEAVDCIRQSSKPSLLFGITGSGKTEVYASLIAEQVEKGNQAILLVPEILLTEHSIQRFQKLLPPERIAILHSRITDGERRKLWRKIRRGDIDLVIGSRSALFAPLPRLTLVILDEEHEWTYKNEQTPRYHARETAEALCRFAGGKLLLGSATPSVESWAKAKNGAYTLVRLPERYGNAKLPTVRVIDLEGAAFGKHYPFSPPLIEAIGERLKKGEQSILFLNRRGVGSALLCSQCRRRIISPASDLPFTVHRDSRGSPFLLDHTSGQRSGMPSACPSCGSVDLRIVGAGTERLEDSVKELFPTARILRADSDTLVHPEQMRTLLTTMRERKADILLGTQSIVKGLDLPQVTLAAVLIADVGLSLPHFRAGERVFQLLTQLTGRSGRAAPGDVIIQTYRPDAPEIRFAAQHKTEEFLDTELKLRLHAGYPPATRMIRFLLRGPDAKRRADLLTIQCQIRNEELQLKLSIHCAPTLFGGGREWQILVRGNKPREMLPKLDLDGVAVDVDPVECV